MGRIIKDHSFNTSCLSRFLLNYMQELAPDILNVVMKPGPSTQAGIARAVGTHEKTLAENSFERLNNYR
jgi:hypothetical protein